MYGISMQCAQRLLELTGFETIAKYYNYPILSRLRPLDKVLQAISRDYCQYICTMYWMVAWRGATKGCSRTAGDGVGHSRSHRARTALTRAVC